MDLYVLKHRISESLRTSKWGDFFRSPTLRDSKSPPAFKDAQYAENIKLEGNELYGKLADQESLLHYKVLHLYNKSIAYAPTGSKELAVAYSNKSALLLRMRRYPECVSEIDKSLKISQSIALKIKLLCRKSECLTALGSCDNRSILKRARFFFSKLENEEEKVKNTLQKLLEKTKLIIDQDKIDTPKENRRKIEALKEVAGVAEQNIWTSVEVKFSEDYGRHLVAKRDFEPGEILYIEKPYHTVLVNSRAYQYCSYCFNYLWKIVPCEHCPWYAFCSEECRDKAWNEYHRMECSVSCHMRADVPMNPSDIFSLFLVTIFFKALEEAGSVDKMQAELELVDENEDPCSRGFSADGEFSNYKSLFSLPLPLTPADLFLHSVIRALTALVGIAKYTQVLGSTYDLSELDKLRENDAAMFVGAFLLKVAIGARDMMDLAGAHLFDPSKMLKSEEERIRDSNKPKSDKPLSAPPSLDASILLISALASAGCVPNVQHFMTFGGKFMTYALEPIKRGSQLFRELPYANIYHHATKPMRQFMHERIYERTCECEACSNDWSIVLNEYSNLEDESVLLPQDANKYLGEMKSLFAEWKENSHKQNYPNMRQIAELRDAVANTWKENSMPSTAIMYAVRLMKLFYINFFGPSETSQKSDGQRLKKKPIIF